MCNRHRVGFVREQVGERCLPCRPQRAEVGRERGAVQQVAQVEEEGFQQQEANSLPAAISWVATNCADPANTIDDIAIAVAAGIPACNARAPKINQKGSTPTRTGSSARIPAANSRRGVMRL